MTESKHPILEPWDIHNQTLQRHVAPPDWVNPTPAGRYNVVVIGGGTAGLVTAAGAAVLGAKVALVERHLLGGDCLNVGCVPSKALIRSARAAAEVRMAGEFGVRVDGVRVDFPAIMERMRKLRAAISPHDSAARFRDLGVDVFLGEGRFIAPDRVEVGGVALRFARAVIATGSRAAKPSIQGIDSVPFLTNETLFSLTTLPQRMGIIGAGPIGCEMAQTFARFGTEVWLVTSERGVLPREERDAAGIVRGALLRDGVKLVCGSTRVAPASGGVHLFVDGAGCDVIVDRLLVAAGRTPNVEGMGLDAAGVRWDEKGVQVNDRLQTTNRRIFACGDVCSPFQFTHAADFMARTVIQNALFHGRAKASALNIPSAIYTSPEIAHTGISAREAGGRGIEVDTLTVNMEEVDRAILDGETEGFVRVHVRRGTDRIIGATIVAAHAGDMISEISVAMKAGMGLKSIAATIHPYPTQAEAVRKTGDLFNRTRLTPLIKSIFSKWLAWQRR